MTRRSVFLLAAAVAAVAVTTLLAAGALALPAELQQFLGSVAKLRPEESASLDYLRSTHGNRSRVPPTSFTG